MVEGLDKRKYGVLPWGFFVAILTVKSPCTLNIIARGAPLVIIVVADNDGCYQMFGIWDNMLLSHPFWKLIFGLLGWVPIRAISLWYAVFLNMALFYHTRDNLYLTWQMALSQRHYHLHCGGSWKQTASQTCWLTVQLPHCMPLEVKVGLETFLCW